MISGIFSDFSLHDQQQQNAGSKQQRGKQVDAGLCAAGSMLRLRDQPGFPQGGGQGFVKTQHQGAVKACLQGIKG